MADSDKLEERIISIEERNVRVEADKAWETSYTRRGLLVLFTYMAIGFYMQAIAIPYPWLNAIVPAVAFMLSTLTLPFFKKLWLKKVFRK
ncbi:MAG: hypothetical protein NTU57_03145 [Candidatus Aenigmarchaeota archaeon]|nr:hypothetical protein [Candidatus Aenigmarchaeota archaeon]